MIYLDNAATTLVKPQQVKTAVAAALETCANPGRGGHRPAMAAAQAVFACRETAADFFGLEQPERVVLTQNATHGLNIAVKNAMAQGGHAVISGYEHNSVARPLEAMKSQGVSYTPAYSRLFDQQDMIDQIEAALQPDTRCVIVNHVSNVFGFIAPLGEIDRLCRQKGLPLIVDASQSAGTLPIRASDYPSAIFICMPGHKGLYGPQGTGLLLCCGDGPLRSLMEGGTGSNSLETSQPDFLPDIFESGTMNVPGAAGLQAGILYVKRRGMDQILAHQRAMMETLVQGLEGFQGLRCYYCPQCQTGVLALTCPLPSEEAARRLADRDICTRAGLHCSPLAHRSAGTLPDGALRLSFSCFNTREEAEETAEIIKEMLKK